MALFKKEEKVEPIRNEISAPQERRTVKNEKDPIASVLAKEMVITGEISFKGKARFDGTVEGDISGEYLILSDTAQVTGNVTVTTLVCHGKVEGNVIAEVVTAHSTSEIHGILKSQNLTVESGASLEGEIHSSSRKQGASASQGQKTNNESTDKNESEKK
ncbi:MAG: polymer-forming cytoskeletal protein [Candidatus Electrothrix sp. ATG1]|nr:polymer-forming cytoskeletal protein [Candidatus Electrothrix sp. ATG1]MCI5208008.1 polymer-forming cytoskeletal protein [Candidatus Electrothrix sp. ATG2]